MKKRMIFVFSLGLVVSCTRMNTEIRTGSLSYVQAADQADDIIIEEISPGDPDTVDENLVNRDMADGISLIDGVELIPWSDDVAAGQIKEAELSDIELSIRDRSISVSKEKIALLCEDIYGFPEAYEDLYIAFFSPESKGDYSLYFNLAVEPDDLQLFDYDAESKSAVKRTDAGRICMESDDSIRISMEEDFAYVIVIEHAEQYPEFGLCIAQTAAAAGADTGIASEDQGGIVLDQIEEMIPDTEAVRESENKTEAVGETEHSTEGVTESDTESELPDESLSESESETEIMGESESESESETEIIGESESESEIEIFGEPESESESETEVIGESESESETETEVTGESESESESETEITGESESEPESETESETEQMVRPEDAELLFVEEIESVPAAMLPIMENQDVLRIRIYYSDGSEQILSGGADSYGNTCEITYEDTAGDDGSVIRAYHLKIVAAESDPEESVHPVERTETIVFRQHIGEEIEDIEAEGRTSVRVYGKKNWVLVKSVPKVTGKYSMQSFGRSVKEMYYLADGETQAVKAEEVFELEKDVTYTFLLKLE